MATVVGEVRHRHREAAAGQVRRCARHDAGGAPAARRCRRHAVPRDRAPGHRPGLITCARRAVIHRGRPVASVAVTTKSVRPLPQFEHRNRRSISGTSPGRRRSGLADRHPADAGRTCTRPARGGRPVASVAITTKSVRPLPQFEHRNRCSTSGTSPCRHRPGLACRRRADGGRTCTRPAPGHSGRAAWCAASVARGGRHASARFGLVRGQEPSRRARGVPQGGGTNLLGSFPTIR